ESKETQNKKVPVPSLAGKSYDQALYELTAAGLLLTKTEDVYSDTVSDGYVVSQSPAAGTELKKGDLVTVTLSKGPEPAPSPTMQSITALGGAGGSISPQGLVQVEEGGEMTFTITPDDGFVIREVKVDGADVGAVSSYTFSNVTESHTIYAVFKPEIFSED
ncbi:MAG: PASTA domain-containing protein, partial [Clostridiales bacterium]|nr:PASTA domain-containing protein [Clostridiales bacterium]